MKFSVYHIKYAVILAGIICSVFLLLDINSTDKIVAAMPRVTSQEELQKAKDSPKTQYVVLNAPLSGGLAADPLHLTTGQYMYIEYNKEVYTESTSSDEDGDTEYSYSWECTEKGPKAVCTTAFLFQTVPLDLANCLIEGKELLHNEQEVILPSMGAGKFVAKEGCYYPEGCGDNVGNARYQIFVVRPGALLAMFAYIGDGQFSLFESAEQQNSGEKPTLYVNGRLEDLQYEASSLQAAILVLMWIGIGISLLIGYFTELF